VRIVEVDGAVQVSKPLTGWNGVGEGFGDGGGGEGEGETISTGQLAGTPRQLVDVGFVVVGAGAFAAAARGGDVGAAAADAADAGGEASGARCADNSALRLVPAVAPPGWADSGADCAVGTVPAGARRSVLSTCWTTAGSVP
jgi:hypothetical protein